MDEAMMTEDERRGAVSVQDARRGRGSRGVYYVHTLGCQMNVHDSERIAGVLEEQGYRAASQRQVDEHDVDVVVLNTCAVRENAADHMYGMIGQWAELKRERPGTQIAVG
ncbi:MAG: tRNA (N6-isopentenyl adenosine(37)-C2)-methylthiotransferase MiaB, partial [Bifidobacterium minimum]|nr:tRNA (N6-isopentenyl adenosine(37)-C2)-methylthiotransferase MiaB [Bifidobacterium minimum]